MDLGALLKVVHALIGVWFVAGLIARWITLGMAARAETIGDVRAMLAVSGRFERIVIVGSQLTLVAGIATAIAQGRPFLGPLQGGRIDWLFVAVVLFISVVPLIPTIFLPKGRVFGAALDEATAAGTITDRLRLAFRDRTVFAAHVYELAVVTTVFVLMVAKPF
jgi:hypothetical protein